MKVLILINSLGKGGAENSTAKFILRVNKQYQSISFVCVYLHRFVPGFYEQIEENKIPLIHLKDNKLISRIRNLRRIIDQHKPDIVHSVLFESNLITRFASIGRKEIYVESLVNKTYSENREFESKSMRFKNLVIKHIDKRTSYLVDHFHSVGFAVVKHYKDVYKRQFDFTVVERGRPYSNISILKDDNKGKLILVTLARHEYQKGLLYLLEAILPFIDKIKLQIVGREGSATEGLKEFIANHNMEDDVEFCGYLNNPLPVLSKADIYVSASLYEGLPGSVIEAMSLKKPLILSDIGEHREVAIENENALFFETKNVNQLSDKIEVFLENNELIEKFSEKSYEIFETRFTEDIMVDGMANFYIKLLKVKN